MARGLSLDPIVQALGSRAARDLGARMGVLVSFSFRLVRAKMHLGRRAALFDDSGFAAVPDAVLVGAAGAPSGGVGASVAQSAPGGAAGAGSSARRKPHSKASEEKQASARATAAHYPNTATAGGFTYIVNEADF